MWHKLSSFAKLSHHQTQKFSACTTPFSNCSHAVKNNWNKSCKSYRIWIIKASHFLSYSKKNTFIDVWYKYPECHRTKWDYTYQFFYLLCIMVHNKYLIFKNCVKMNLQFQRYCNLRYLEREIYIVNWWLNLLNFRHK